MWGEGGRGGSILYVSAVPPRCSAAERNSGVLSLLVCVRSFRCGLFLFNFPVDVVRYYSVENSLFVSKALHADFFTAHQK